MLGITFEGWTLIRLATNPDPTDEPRGVSGYTFALPGEPDFDRVIRLQVEDGSSLPRSRSRPIGVRVTSVKLAGATQPNHPLEGAEVVLLNTSGEPPREPTDDTGPKFEARNYVLTVPGSNPIYPFHIQIAQHRPRVILRRKAILDPKHPDRELHLIPQDILRPFGAVSTVPRSANVMAATGIHDFLGFRRQRRADLTVDLTSELDKPRGQQDENTVAGLRKRIAELRRDDLTALDPAGQPIPYGRNDRRVVTLGLCQTRNFALTGEPTVEGEEHLGGSVTSEEWPIHFWFGGWDCDTLTAYMKGTLVLPLEPRSTNRRRGPNATRTETP